jgi:hypothetical protein
MIPLYTTATEYPWYSALSSLPLSVLKKPSLYLQIKFNQVVVKILGTGMQFLELVYFIVGKKIRMKIIFPLLQIQQQHLIHPLIEHQALRMMMMIWM